MCVSRSCSRDTHYRTLSTYTSVKDAYISKERRGTHMRSLNKALLLGNLTRDVELRYTPQGAPVASTGMATNRSWKTESGEVREETTYHTLVLWNKVAELATQLLHKGSKVYVEGRITTRIQPANQAYPER